MIWCVSCCSTFSPCSSPLLQQKNVLSFLLQIKAFSREKSLVSYSAKMCGHWSLLRQGQLQQTFCDSLLQILNIDSSTPHSTSVTHLRLEFPEYLWILGIVSPQSGELLLPVLEVLALILVYTLLSVGAPILLTVKPSTPIPPQTL